MNQALKDHILANYSELVQQKAYRAIAMLLNGPAVDVPGDVPMSTVLLWMAQNGIKPRLKGAVAIGNSQNATEQQVMIGVLADAGLDLVTSPHVGSLDMSDPLLGQMFAGLVQAGVIPQAAYDQLMAVSIKKIGMAQSLTGADVTDTEVMLAMEAE